MACLAARAVTSEPLKRFHFRNDFPPAGEPNTPVASCPTPLIGPRVPLSALRGAQHITPHQVELLTSSVSVPAKASRERPGLRSSREHWQNPALPVHTESTTSLRPSLRSQRHTCMSRPWLTPPDTDPKAPPPLNVCRCLWAPPHRSGQRRTSEGESCESAGVRGELLPEEATGSLQCVDPNDRAPQMAVQDLLSPPGVQVPDVDLTLP